MTEKPGLQLADRLVDRHLYEGEPIVRASRWGCVYVSSTLKDWLTRHVAEWVAFESAELGEAG